MPRTPTRVKAVNGDAQKSSGSQEPSSLASQPNPMLSRGSSWKKVKPVELVEEEASPSNQRGEAYSDEDEQTEIRIKDLDSGKEFTVLKARYRIGFACLT